MAPYKVTEKKEWRQVYKGPKSLAKQRQAQYRAAGYYTRVRKHKGFYTLEVGELVYYNLERKVQW